MSVKLIAENTITESNFLSATEQANPFWPIPTPAAANAGSFRLQASGTPADFSYSGTATSDGAVDGTTLLDSVLAAYGDDFFISGTIAITDFVQDTGDYTEEDGPGRAAKTTANKITITDLDDDEEVWEVIDKGAAHFNGDFEFHTQINCTANAGAGDPCGLWAVSNNVGTLTNIDTANGDYLAVYWKEILGTNLMFVEECNGGVITNDSTLFISKVTEYYLKIVRTESVGAFGTLYLYIYSDITHTTLVRSVSLLLTEKQDFRYLYWMVAVESGNAGAAWDGTIQNFEIVKSESKTISDFAQATGTITIPAFTYQVNLGTVFTLTIPFSTRSFKVYQIAGGDAGTATFKWYHDGATYLGRNNPNQANWLALATIDATISAINTFIVQADNGNILAIYKDSGDNLIKVRISSNCGITWGAEAEITGAASGVGAIPSFAMKLLDGRILFYSMTGAVITLSYSDDNGVAWNSVTVVFTGAITEITGVVELSNNNIYVVGYVGTIVYGYLSTDGGFTFGDKITIEADGQYGSICKTKSGVLICAYDSDVDSAADWEIKCRRSTDNGATWSTPDIEVIDFGAADVRTPRLLTDINGDIYCIAYKDTADQKIVFSRSNDEGLTWGIETQLITTGGKDYAYPAVALIDGHEIWCCFANVTDADMMFVRRGIWETYSANACPCAINGTPQELVCDAEITWYGGAGIAADTWTFVSDYLYSMKNLISDSPSKPWRSITDSTDNTIVLDAGTNGLFYANAVAFFGCNARQIKFQMNATNAWGAPSVNETVSFDIAATGEVDTITKSVVEDAALMPSYKDHYFRGMYFIITVGAFAGLVIKIKDNVGNYIIFDTTADMSAVVSVGDDFAIFNTSVSKTFAGGFYRFMRIFFDSQVTFEDYHQIGSIIVGRATTLTDAWAVGYGKDRQYNIDYLSLPSGGIIPIKTGDPIYKFNLIIPASTATNTELISIADLLSGRNLALIPDSTVLTDVYLCKFDKQITQRNHFLNTFEIGFSLIEVK